MNVLTKIGKILKSEYVVYDKYLFVINVVYHKY